MTKKNNYYKELTADYSKPGGTTSEKTRKKLLDNYKYYTTLKEATLPLINHRYSLEQIEKENKEWWTARCEAVRRGRGDLLGLENAQNFVYLCQDGPFFGTDGVERTSDWWAILSQPGTVLIWPVVMFHSETVYFEWSCLDNDTNETIAQGNVTYLRRGHKGGCYLKTEKLAFYRQVSASEQLKALAS